MSAGGQLLLVWLLAALAQTAAWLHQRRTRNAGIVDVIWAGGVGAAAMLLGALGRGAPLSRLLLALFGGLWGLRLALHLWRRVSRETEDGRYASLRALWGEDQRRWFAFFQFQALLIALFTVPFLPAANAVREPSTPWLAAAAAVWLLGVVGETVADRQLARFRSDPGNKGRVCQIGLWRYSRHPNYFFEWLHWFTYVALACGAALSWLGPVVMYVFLRWLSGIPFTEAQALRTRGEAYRAYQRTTPILIPWFPRNRR
jgi:steroid 5-alpha reductase family enzyme